MSIVARQSLLYSFITCWYFLVTLLKCSWYAVRGKPKLHPIVPAQVLQITNEIAHSTSGVNDFSSVASEFGFSKRELVH